MSKYAKIALLSASLFFAVTLCAQDNYSVYYDLRNKAMEHHALENYNDAIALYEKAFASAYPFPDDLKHLYKCYLQVGKKADAQQVLRRMVMCGYKYKNTQTLVGGQGYNRIVETDKTILENQQFLNEYDSLRKEYMKQVDYEADMNMKAVAVCETFASKSRGYARDDDDDKEYRFITRFNFRVKDDFFFELMKSDVNIDRKRTDTWEEFGITLIHTAQSYLDTVVRGNLPMSSTDFMNLLWREVLKGNLHAEQYAVIEDILFSATEGNESLSLLGIQVGGIEGDPSLPHVFKIAPLAFPEKVDALRKEKFLPPLWVRGKLNNRIALPDNYKK